MLACNLEGVRWSFQLYIGGFNSFISLVTSIPGAQSEVSLGEDLCTLALERARSPVPPWEPGGKGLGSAKGPPSCLSWLGAGGPAGLGDFGNRLFRLILVQNQQAPRIPKGWRFLAARVRTPKGTKQKLKRNEYNNCELVLLQLAHTWKPKHLIINKS